MVRRPVQVRRRPEKSLLYQLVSEHAETLFAEARSRSASGAGYPRHVVNEFRRFLECGVLGRGFARIRCEDCGEEELLAFSCKVRSLCPSCVGRRMADMAARLCDEGLPIAPYRQWTFSFPWRLRLPLAQDGKLLARVFRICMRKVFCWQRKRARGLGIEHPRTLGVLFVQRFGSLLQLNIHGHAAIPDGVFADDGQGGLAFRPLPPPSDEEVHWVCTAIARAVLKLLSTWEACESDEDETQHLLAPASQSGPRPLFEQESSRPGRRRAAVQTELGTFSVHANTSVESEDRAGLERMLCYAARPAFAQKRLSLLPSGKVCYRLRRPYYTGQTEVVAEPVDFLRKLASLIPPPRQNQIRFYGLLTSQAYDRAKLEALLPLPIDEHRDEVSTKDKDAQTSDNAEVDQAASKAARMSWAKLLARVFEKDVKLCPSCGGQRRIIAWIPEPEPIAKILNHLGLSTQVPAHKPARAPPQMELFQDPGS